MKAVPQVDVTVPSSREWVSFVDPRRLAQAQAERSAVGATQACGGYRAALIETGGGRGRLQTLSRSHHLGFTQHLRRASEGRAELGTECFVPKGTRSVAGFLGRAPGAVV